MSNMMLAKWKVMLCCFMTFSAKDSCFPDSTPLTTGPACGFHGIEQIQINSDKGSIKFSRSKDNITRVHATGPDACSAAVFQEGNMLKVENKRSFWGFGFSKHVDILIELGRNSVPETSISLGNGGIEIKAAIQNLKVNAGKLNMYAEDLDGNTDINTGYGIFTFVHRVFKPVSYNVKAGNAQITLLLSHGYKSVSNHISGRLVQLRESSFPVRYDDADFNLSGKVGKADIFFRDLID